ncbi:hypothetical protein H072_6181 [Dactylellina haptotyla CBS 200.50]|uniref:SET domain-containing protein n=1 Tax=Dactylellina haptotyla (strain CBS 200.50) TaxID=1284197 RepID=S8AAP0_DACHA|nr:hypothetical protein H072_6181 [Dactylellina haptotyla CBS 200.50]
MTISRAPTPDISPLTLKDTSGEAEAEGGPETFVRTDLYEERQTPESGIGAFATSLISSGTRIFCEESIVMLPDYAGQLELHRMVKALPDDKQKMFWNLAASSKPGKAVAWIDLLRASCGDDESDTFNNLVEEYERAWSIYETNRFTCRSLDGASKSLGMFPMCARINHSCAPNVFHRYSPSINRLTIHALRDIQPGEELLTSYIDICHPTVIRRQLLKHWGFRCRCTACDSSDDEEDHRRRRIEDLFNKMANREKKRERNEAKWTEKDYERSFANVSKAIKLLEEEGMEETDTLGVVYAAAVKLGLKLRREEEAVEWAQKVVEIEVKCLGTDSKEYQTALQLLETAKSARQK